jgi:ABC-type uncharacterized transport system involved in gliding motility auxiliary subunit
MKKSTVSQLVLGLVAVAAFAGILAGLGYILAGLGLRLDLTAGGLYTLSDGTRRVLKELPREVELQFYLTRGEGVPIPLKQYGERVRDLLGEYGRHGGGRIAVRNLDPQPDSDAEEWAQKYGLEPQNLNPLGGGPDLYLGLVVRSGAKEGVLPFLSPNDEPQLEYKITRLIGSVVQTSRPKVALLSSLPVAGGPPPMPWMQPPSRPAPAWVFHDELQKSCEVVTVEPGAEAIPEGTTLLLVIHPSEIPEPTLFAIDQYLLGGGRLVAFVDPACLTQQELMPAQNPQMMMMGGNKSDLNRLTEAWGLRLDTGEMVADTACATPVRMGPQRAEYNPAWLSVREALIDRKDVATAPLRFLMMPFAGAFSGEPARELSMTTLVRTSDGAGLADSMQAMFGVASPDKVRRSGMPLPLAVKLSGTFKTAFPDGDPKAAKPAGDEKKEGEEAKAPAAAATASARKEGDGKGIAVLVADVDMLYDRFAVEEVSFLGFRQVQLANDNLNFALNLVEQLTGGDALISLRSRGSSDRPFTRVLEMQARAQERGQEEVDRLEQRLSETKERLSALQQRKQDAGQKLILSDEQRQEIEKFQQEERETARQLKDVRKSLRREIETLGWWLKGLNILAVPLLVAAFGVVRGVARRHRAGA